MENMGNGKSRCAYRILVSATAVAILGAQASTLLATIALKPVGGWFWPIIDYPMYAPAGYEDDPVDSEYALHIMLDDGSTRPVTREELGLNVFHFFYLTNSIAKRRIDSSLTRVLDTLPDHHRIRAVTVSSSGKVITRHGIAQRAPKVLATLNFVDGTFDHE